jgi:hypothetical protein
MTLHDADARLPDPLAILANCEKARSFSVTTDAKRNTKGFILAIPARLHAHMPTSLHVHGLLTSSCRHAPEPPRRHEVTRA